MNLDRVSRLPGYAWSWYRDWMLFPILTLVYIPTAAYGSTSIDVAAAEYPAWVVATRGSLNLSVVMRHPELAWFFEHGDGVYSDRFPGAIAYLVPGYWVADRLGMSNFSIMPGAVTAAVVTALAIVVMRSVYEATLPSRKVSLVATFYTAFGTGAWSICANAPWSHTLDLLLLALSLLAMARRKYIFAGLAFGGVVLTRPQWAVALVLGAFSLGVLMRRVGPVWKISLGMLPGVVLLVSYNGLLFGRWGPSNGHELGGSLGVYWSDLPLNIVGAMASPTRGLLVFYPVILLALLRLRTAIHAAQPWQQAAAISGTAGLVVQLALNRYSGGDTFFGPRLMIEPLVLWAPILALSVYRFSIEHPRSVVLPTMLGAGVALHGAAAVLLPY